MRVLEVILEKESDGLLNNLIGNLKKTPKVKGPIEQFKNDPNKIHSSARAKFRQWATRSGLAYLNTNVMETRQCWHNSYCILFICSNDAKRMWITCNWNIRCRNYAWLCKQPI